jgi:ribose/xylose/arabinose/galactoside ABC-type transport system permease subunit
VASLGAVVGGLVITGSGNVWLGILAGVATGVVTGLCNGLLIEYLRLNSLVVTLGFLNVWAGAALFLTNGRTIAGYPPQARELSQWALLDVVPFPMFVLIVVALAAWFFLNYRPFGRRLLATGGNPRAAYLMGIGVHGVRMRLFILTGAGAGLAGVLMSLKLQSAAPTTGSGLEFSALTVVLLGGVAVAGGHGRISGVIAGLLFVGVLRNGLIFLGVSQFLQTMIIGLTLIIAISLDETLQRVMKSAWNRLAKQDASPPAPHPAPLAPVDAGTK